MGETDVIKFTMYMSGISSRALPKVRFVTNISSSLSDTKDAKRGSNETSRV